MPTFTEFVRPVKMGISESLGSTTTAPYTPTGSGGVWLRTDGGDSMSSSVVGRSNISAGQILRLSTNSIYAGVNQASIGDTILQPDINNGGVDVADAVGTLACYVPLANNITVDCAARTLNPYNECPMIHDYTDFSTTTSGQIGYGVRREMYNTLSGTTVSVIGVGANNPDGKEDLTVNGTAQNATITYDTDGSGGTATSTFTLIDMITTETPTDADSTTRGAPVYDEYGQIIGLWVGEDDSGNGVIQKATNIEQVFGGRILTGYRLGVIQ